jgi:SAM-dependent methyltransferase
MSDSRQNRHGTQPDDDAPQPDDDLRGRRFADQPQPFAVDEFLADRHASLPRRPEDALAEIESLERLIAEVRDDDCSIPHLSTEPTEPLTVRLVEAPRRIEVTPCIICHGVTATSRFSITGVPEELVVCDTCGLGSLFPLPGEQRVAELATIVPVHNHQSGVRGVFEAVDRLRTLWQLRSVPRGGRVLELSCGDQSALSIVVGSRFDTFAFRISCRAPRPDGRSRGTGSVRDLVDAAFDTGSFEAVVLRGTLERHPQPQRLLEEVRRVLRPGGLLTATLPNFASWQAAACGANWSHLGLPRTLHHFTPETLRRLLLRSEFESVAVRHSTLSGFVRQLPLDTQALNSLKFVNVSSPGLLQSLIRCRGTMTVTARLSNLQPVDALLRAGLPARLSGALT